MVQQPSKHKECRTAIAVRRKKLADQVNKMFIYSHARRTAAKASNRVLKYVELEAALSGAGA